MFGNKKDRHVVEISIEFNITAIGRWLKSGAEFADIVNLDRDWLHAGIQRYVIDMFPIGQESNAYLHRNKGVISQNIAGIDRLGNMNNEEIKWRIEKQAEVEKLEWEMWRGGLTLHVWGIKNTEGYPIFLTPPLTEIVELERSGKIKSHEKVPILAVRKETEVDVPYSFDDNNNPKEFTKVWRWSGNAEEVSFSNALGRVSFSARKREVQY